MAHYGTLRDYHCADDVDDIRGANVCIGSEKLGRSMTWLSITRMVTSDILSSRAGGTSICCPRIVFTDRCWMKMTLTLI